MLALPHTHVMLCTLRVEYLIEAMSYEIYSRHVTIF